MARARVGRVVAGVAAVEPHREHRSHDRDHHRQRDDRQRPRPCLHDAAPPAPRRRARGGDCRTGAVAAGNGRFATTEQAPSCGMRAHQSGAPAREERRQHRERGREHHQHGDHGCDREAVHERHPGGEHPEQGDHHGRSREQDCPPGGVHRLDHRAVDVAELRIVLLEARDDEQRVVDPDAEADHQRQLGPDAGDAHHSGGESDQGHARDQAKAGRDQRHPRCGERAERDQEDDQRGDHADLGGGPDAEALGLLDHLTARRDLQTGHVHPVDLVEHGRAGAVRQQVGALVVADRRERGLVVRRDLDDSLRGVRADHARHVRELAHPRQQRRDRATHRRRGDRAP